MNRNKITKYNSEGVSKIYAKKYTQNLRNSKSPERVNAKEIT